MIDPMPLPPQNLDAERRVIGSILLDNSTIFEVAKILRPEDFYRDNHQVLFRSILALHERSEKIDALLLIEELTRSGELDKAGGDSSILDALGATPSAANARYHADIVRQKAITREILASSERCAPGSMCD